MAKKITFAVSTPCNAKGKPSGYRLIEYTDRGLTILAQEKDDLRADIDINVQAFCYLRPRDRTVVPTCINESLMDSSDYLVVAKSSGFIEIVQDFHYKAQHGLALNPSFVLKCTPEGFPEYRCDSMVAGLEYMEGLLYCCMCSGKIYVFVLNLPSDYIQSENSYVTGQVPELFYGCRNQDVPLGRDSRSMEETTFCLSMKFTGRSKLKHICYYLLPMEPDHRSTSPSVFLLGQGYMNNFIFKPSIYVELDQGLTAFRINPLDRLSFFTVSPRSAMMIRKIMLPTVYVDFFVSFVSKKKVVQEMRHEEIVSWNKVAQEMGYESFVNWIQEDPLHELENTGSFAWEELARYDGISTLRTIIVWIQRQGQGEDDLSKLFRRNDVPSGQGSGQRSTTESPPVSGIRRSSSIFRRQLREPVDLPCSSNWELDSFVRGVKKNTFTVDFKVVQSSFSLSQDDIQLEADEEEQNRTSFLTDSYKNMDIVCIDRYLSLSVFRPRYHDIALLKVDTFQGDLPLKLPLTDERNALQKALSNFSSFKKLFMLTNSLCMVLDTHGVLLIDRLTFLNKKNAQIPDDALKVAEFDIGLISDAILVVTRLDTSPCNVEVEYQLIITCVPGQILALEGAFHRNSSFGELFCRDSLRLKRKDRFVDQICLINYEPPGNEKKRLSGAGNYPVITKRTRWE